MEFFESPQLIRWHTAIPHPWFNGVLSLQPADAAAKQTIQAMVVYFKTRDVPIFTWWLDSSLQPADWAGQLLSQGFGYDENTPGMAMDLALLPQSVPQPTNLVIRQVEDLETLREWTRTFITGYQIPQIFTTPFFELVASLGLDLPFRHYLGYVNDQPVATSTLFLGAGVAGIYYVATLPVARGQGIGAAMTLAPLHEAAHIGYHGAVLQSSEMGYGVYQRLGFQKLRMIDNFYWAAKQSETPQ